MTRSRHIARELGAAFAVLAIYMLVLLAPLHQMGGLQRDLAKLGFESTTSWSVCTSISDTTSDETPLAAKCPLTGVAKFELAALPFDAAVVAPVLESGAVFYAGGAGDWHRGIAAHPGRPRAPPALA